MQFCGLGATIFYFFIGVFLVWIFSKTNVINLPAQRFNMILCGFISVVLLHKIPLLILFPIGVAIVCLLGIVFGVDVGRLAMCHGGLAFAYAPHTTSFLLVVLIPSIICMIIKQIHIVMNL